MPFLNKKTGSSLTSNSTIDEMTVAINAIKTLEQATTDANATAGNILVDKTAYVNGAKITGTMPNKGAITTSLNCGGSYTIPAGYHNGSGKVTANSLASQTSANATTGDILSGKTAWVNGSKITGTMANQGAITPGKSIVQFGDEVYCRMPQGAYLTNTTSGYPEISYSQGDVATALGLTANKLVAGNTIGGIAGTATIQSLGGKQYYETTLTDAVYISSDKQSLCVNISLPFTPSALSITWYSPRIVWCPNMTSWANRLDEDAYGYISYTKSNGYTNYKGNIVTAITNIRYYKDINKTSSAISASQAVTLVIGGRDSLIGFAENTSYFTSIESSHVKISAWS